MGACMAPLLRGPPAHVYIVCDVVVGQGNHALETFRRLKLSDDDINRFYSCFVLVDRDGSGEIDLDEFYRFFGQCWWSITFVWCSADRQPFGRADVVGTTAMCLINARDTTR